MIAIVVVAYNRPIETRRLLDSIGSANINCSEHVDLVLSIDKGPNHDKVYDVCKDFKWRHGDFRIIRHKSRLGLRLHILKCGELTDEYSGVIVLEDDLVVSPNFYNYAKTAMNYYDSDERVAQISLYSYAVNEFTSRPFYPQKSEYDVYAMRVTQSWGECWTRRMWRQFKSSIYYQRSILEPRNDVPSNVNNWKENSWKKNFTNYIVESGKYVIYPYYSLSTNYTIAGEHCKFRVPDYHVVMQSGNKSHYFLGALDDCVKYDQFFEYEQTFVDGDKFKGKRVCFDLYGKKTEFEGADILISTAARPYKIIYSYGLELKPHELNVILNNGGNDIFVYDIHEQTKCKKTTNNYSLIRYDIGCIYWKRTLVHAIKGIAFSIENRLRLTKK